MSSNGHIIPDLKEKITLLLSNQVNKISSQAILSRVSKIGAPTINKWLKHHYLKIGESDFKKLCETYKDIIPEELWFQPIEKFAQELNLKWVSPQNSQINSPILNKIEGIDFDSRIKDKKFLERRFEIMKGYWEIFSHSLSNIDGKYISFGLLEIVNLNDNGFIECVMEGENLDYHGYCFLVGDQTYLILEAKTLANEIIYIMADSPKQILNPILKGVATALPGYNNNSKVYITPSSVKILLSHIGTVFKVKEKYQLSNDIITKQLADKIETLINSKNYLLSNDILDAIDNHIPQNAIPYALRADIKHDVSTDNCKILAQLQNTLNNNSLCEIERKCLTDYLDVLKNAVCDGEYRFIKLFDYYDRIGLLAKNTNKNIIATYVYEDYDPNSTELNKFTKMYFETQVKLIKKKMFLFVECLLLKIQNQMDFF